MQADRLEMEIVGWGRDEESWSIAHHVIPGDVMRNEVWDHLEGLLLAEYLHDSGQPIRIVAACIDCGFKDATVLRFTRDRYARRVYAVKGRAGESPIWPRKPGRDIATFRLAGTRNTSINSRPRRSIRDITMAIPGRNGANLPPRGTRRWTVGCTLTRHCTRSTQAV